MRRRSSRLAARLPVDELPTALPGHPLTPELRAIDEMASNEVGREVQIFPSYDEIHDEVEEAYHADPRDPVLVMVARGVGSNEVLSIHSANYDGRVGVAAMTHGSLVFLPPHPEEDSDSRPVEKLWLLHERNYVTPSDIIAIADELTKIPPAALNLSVLVVMTRGGMGSLDGVRWGSDVVEYSGHDKPSLLSRSNGFSSTVAFWRITTIGARRNQLLLVVRAVAFFHILRRRALQKLYSPGAGAGYVAAMQHFAEVAAAVPLH